MIEILKMPSGHSAVTMNNQIVMTINVNDLPGAAGSDLLTHVANNLIYINTDSGHLDVLNNVLLAQPPEDWGWDDILQARSEQHAIDKLRYESEANDAGITLSSTNDEDGYILVFSGNEPPSDTLRHLETSIFEDKYLALSLVHYYLQGRKNEPVEANAPGM